LCYSQCFIRMENCTRIASNCQIFESWPHLGRGRGESGNSRKFAHLISSPIRFRHDHHDCVLSGHDGKHGCLAAIVCSLLVYLFVVCRLLVPHPHSMCHRPTSAYTSQLVLVGHYFVWHIRVLSYWIIVFQCVGCTNHPNV
jgi:hypothetical protein